MRYFALLLITAIASFGAVNKNLPGAVYANGNDKNVVQSISDSLVGSSDTGFIACGIGATYCNTSAFNLLRNPVPGSATGGSNLGSSVVSANPDSIVCNFMVVRKDADTSDGTAGIYYNLGTSTSPVWSLFGGSVTAIPTNATLTKYRVVAPWVAGRQFRPWITVTTATDTVRVRFVQCKDK